MADEKAPRIPQLNTHQLETQREKEKAVTRWCLDMQEQGLLFHFDDDPNDIIDSKTGCGIFTNEEVRTLDHVLNHIFEITTDPCSNALIAMRCHRRRK